jgi:hypothetical protein
MESTTNVAPISKSQLLTGRVLSTLGVLFLLMDAIMKFVKPAVVVETTGKLGYSASVITPLGIVLLTCVALYCIPRTRVLGAILLTGYLGGAVATHVRVGDPLFSHILFPAYIASLLWLGLYLRDPALRAFVPLRKAS